MKSAWIRCNDCNNYLPTEKSLRKHVRYLHSEKKVEKMVTDWTSAFKPCPFRDELIQWPNNSLSKHCTENHLDIVAKVWSLCDVCGQYLPRNQISYHKVTHFRTHKCQFCDAVVMSEYLCNQHANAVHKKGRCLLLVLFARDKGNLLDFFQA